MRQINDVVREELGMICRRAGAVAAATVIGAGLVLAGPARADEVKVGVLGAFTGPYAEWGTHFQRAVDLFMAEHHGRAGTHQVKIIYRDDGGNNPGRAKQLAQELIVRDGVQYLAGLEFTPTVLSVADVITQAKMPFVIFNSSTPFVVRKSPYYIRTGYTQWQASYPAAEYAAEHGATRAVIISADYAPGEAAIEAYTKGFTDKGGKIIDVIKVPLDTNDMSSYLQRIQDDKPDTLFTFMPGGPMAIGLVKGWVDRGLRASGMKYWGGGELDETYLPAVGDAAIGALSAGYYGPYLDNPQNKKFVAAYEAKYHELPNVEVIDAWDGMQVVFHMIEATDGRRDGDKAMQSVKGYKWNSPRGPLEIDPKTRDIIQNVYIRAVKKVDGKLEDVLLYTYPMVKDQWKELHPEG